MIAAHAGEISVLIWLQGKAILWLPFAMILAAHREVTTLIRNSIGALALDLFISIIEQQWFEERVTETHIDQPTLLQLDQKRHVIERLTKAPIRIGNLGREHRHVKAETAQQGGE